MNKNIGDNFEAIQDKITEIEVEDRVRKYEIMRAEEEQKTKMKSYLKTFIENERHNVDYDGFVGMVKNENTLNYFLPSFFGVSCLGIRYRSLILPSLLLYPTFLTTKYICENINQSNN